MREAIRQKIAELVPELKGKLFDVLPPNGQKVPFAVIALGEEIWKSGWAGYRRVVRVRLYGSPAEASTRDEQVRKLIDGLHRIPVSIPSGGSTVMFHYLGSREGESADSSSGIAVRTLRFGIYIPEPQGRLQAGSFEDQWLAALVAWTRGQLGNGWAVYRDLWPPDPGSSSMLWRMTNYETRLPGASMYEVRKSFAGHLIAPDVASEQRTIIQLAERLSAQIQLPLDAEKRRYLSVVEMKADVQADAIMEGQVRLTLAQRQMRPVEEAALIRRVEMQPKLK